MISRRLLPFSEDNSYSFIHSSTNLKYLQSYKEATSSGFLAQQVPASDFSFISWGVFLSPLHLTFSQEIIAEKPHTDSILMYNLTHLREKYPRKGRHCIPVDCWSQKHAVLEGWRFSMERGHPPVKAHQGLCPSQHTAHSTPWNKFSPSPMWQWLIHTASIFMGYQGQCKAHVKADVLRVCLF